LTRRKKKANLTILDAPVIFGAITIFGIVTWWVTPEDQWLPNARLGKLREMEDKFDLAAGSSSPAHHSA